MPRKYMRYPFGDCVYLIYCSGSNKFYIGRAQDPINRFSQHISSDTSAVFPEVKAHGANSVTMLILKSKLNTMEAMSYEAKYIFENYFKLDLLNRACPSVNNIFPLIHNSEDLKRWLNLLNEIDEDQRSNHPRIKFHGNTAKSLSNRFMYFIAHPHEIPTYTSHILKVKEILECQ